MRRQVGKVLQHGLMYKAGAPAPVIFGQGVRDHRHIAQIGHLGQFVLHPRIEVQVGRAPPAPVQRGRAFAALALHVLKHRLDRRKPGARCQQHERLVAVVAQEEAAIRPLQPQDVARLHAAKHGVGEFSARHMPDMQLQRRRARHLGLRRIGYRVAAPRAVAQHDFDILAGAVSKIVIGRQLQLQQHHVVRHFVHGADTGRHLPDRQRAFQRHLARLQHHVAVRYAAAGQHHALRFFQRAQRLALVRSVHHHPFELLAFASAAGAVLASVGQAQA